MNPPVTISTSSFEFGWFPHWSAGLVCLLVMVLAGTIYYAWRAPSVDRWRWWTLVAIRCSILLIGLFLVFDPQWVRTLPRAGEQAVLFLFDNSQSMQVEDEDGVSRGVRVQQAFRASETSLLEPLQERYATVFYQVGESLQPVSSVESLSFHQTTSDLSGGMDQALQEWDPDQMAAVVLVTDGIQQPLRPEQTERDFPLPLIVIGVDETTSWSDLAVESVQVQRPHFDKSSVKLTAMIRAEGYQDTTIDVTVVHAERTVARQSIAISRQDETIPVQMDWLPTEEGWLEYSLHVQPQASAIGTTPEDRVPQNNREAFVIDNRSVEYRILYVSGRPNWEHTFVRRALREDEQLRLTSLIQLSAAQRTFVFRGARTQTVNPLFEGFDDSEEDMGRYDEPIFLRIGAEAHELTTGFPDEASELFGYDLVILGDIEKRFFTNRQLELIREFVSERGGSFLMMGGPRSFVDGGYASSPIDSLLPAILLEQDQYVRRERDPLGIRPTLEGEIDGVFSLAASARQNDSRWDAMPNLYGITPLSIIRPGATVLAHTTDEDPVPVYVSQRFGEGRSAIMASGETWPWHMHAPQDESRFGMVWRQIIRSLVDDVPGPLSLESLDTQPVAGEAFDLHVRVRDKAFEPVSGARLDVSIVPPDGEDQSLPVRESIRQLGRYHTEWSARDAGFHRVTATVPDGDDEPMTVEAGIWVEDDQREWERLKAELDWLRQKAVSSGGNLIGLGEIDTIPNLIPLRETTEIETVRQHINRWPGWYFLLLVLFSVEWVLRRTRGLP